jgi:hypothetical protein
VSGAGFTNVGFLVGFGVFPELVHGDVAMTLKLDEGVGGVGKIARMPTALRPRWEDSSDLGTTHGGSRSEDSRGNTAISNVVCRSGNMFANISCMRGWRLLRGLAIVMDRGRILKTVVICGFWSSIVNLKEGFLC